MSEENKNENNLIPKTELEKLKTETQQTIDGMKKQVEEAKLQLLSQEYLEYLENKKSGKAPETKGESEENKALRAELAAVRAQQADLAAHIELDMVRKAHPDFEEFRTEVQKVLEESKTNITIEQAYRIAKGSQEPKKQDDKKPVLPQGNEKPSGVYPPPETTEKKFKTAHAAAMDAAASVLSKYNLSGDTI